MIRSGIHRFVALTAFLALLLPTGCAEQAPRLTPGEGYAEMPGGRVWYRVVGTGSGTPLILLHGGPGVPSYYLNPLAALSDDRSVVFYDQLGAGRSDHTADTTLWTIPHFVAELDSLRRTLGLRRVHLLGHSWGTVLAVEYYFAHPETVKSLVLASPSLSTTRWVEDADSLLLTLPGSLQQAIARHEADGTYGAPEYRQAVMAYYHRYLARRQPWSPDMDSTFAGLNTALYEYMWGPSEFTATGTLRDVDLTDSLSLIDVPTLFVSGEYDGARPATVRYYASLVPGAEVAIIPGAAHLTMQDKPDEVVSVVREFLRRVDRGESFVEGDMIFWARGDAAQAGPLLERAARGLNGPPIEWPLARVLAELGRPRDALRYFLALGPDPLAHYEAGKIYEGLGDYAEARDAYAFFVSAWEEPDREFQPMVADARSRMVAVAAKVD